MSKCPHCGKQNSPILNGWQEIADYLGIHRSSVQEKKIRSTLPIAKIGGNVMTTRNALEVWIVDNMPQNLPQKKKK